MLFPRTDRPRGRGGYLLNPTAGGDPRGERRLPLAASVRWVGLSGQLRQRTWSAKAAVSVRVSSLQLVDAVRCGWADAGGDNRQISPKRRERTPIAKAPGSRGSSVTMERACVRSCAAQEASGRDWLPALGMRPEFPFQTRIVQHAMSESPPESFIAINSFPRNLYLIVDSVESLCSR